MEVILRQDVEKLGRRGDVVSVSAGYGRNFLIPRGMAWHATAEAKRALGEEQQARERKVVRERQEAAEFAKKIEAVSCTVSMRAGADDKLFGAVTSQQIAAVLAQEGVELDRRKIELEQPIKELGVYQVPIKIHRDVTAQLKVWVVRE